MHVSSYKIEKKKIWDKLYVAYKGTSEVKSSMLNVLLHDYEIFSIQPHEIISNMFTPYTNIMTSLHALG